MTRLPILIARALLIASLFLLLHPVTRAAFAGTGKNPEILSIEVVTKLDHTSIFINLSSKPKAAPRTFSSAPFVYLNIDGASLPAGMRYIHGDERASKIHATQLDRSTVWLSILTADGQQQSVSFEERETYIITVDIRDKTAQAPEAAVEAPAREDWHKKYYLNLGGYARNETAYAISGPGGLTKVRNIFYLSSTGFIAKDISYKASVRGIYDAVFDLTDNFPRSVEEDQESEADLRDTYIDVSRGDWDLRLGKQPIVWGEAVGLFFADVVNPKDLREFVLPDFEYIRKPVWAADIEYTRNAFHLEIVWIPVPEFNEIGAQGSKFPQAIPVPSGVLPSFKGTVEPSASLENSEAGVRASYLVNGWDLSVFHLYAWDRSPANYRAVTTPSLYTFSPEHKRLNITGATLAKEVDDIILKGEFVYTHGKLFSILDANDADGVVKRDFLDYLIGLDYTFFDRLDANFQLMQRVIFGSADGLFRQDKVQTSASVWLKTGFRGNTIEPEILFISNLREPDMMIRPKVTFRYGGHWLFRAGLDIFEGVDDGIFGQYGESDRAYVETEYNF